MQKLGRAEASPPASLPMILRLSLLPLLSPKRSPEFNGQHDVLGKARACAKLHVGPHLAKQRWATPKSHRGQRSKRSEGAEEPARITPVTVQTVSLEQDAAKHSGGHLGEEDERSGSASEGSCGRRFPHPTTRTSGGWCFLCRRLMARGWRTFASHGRHRHRISVHAWVVEGISERQQ